MPQIEEARLRQLEADAGRVPTLESERDTAVTERDTAREELATERRTTRATRLIGERAEHAKVEFTALEVRGLLADLPVTDGALDEAAFTTAVDEATQAKTAGITSSGVTGFGASAPSGEVAESGRPAKTPWGRPLTEKGA